MTPNKLEVLRPKIFIGSSQQNIRIAHLLRQQLEKQFEKGGVEAIIWDEGIFNLNRGFLEDLMNQIDGFDFAILVFAADDVTLSKAELNFSTRDNVLFELGLFMGRLGRDRVFVAYDNSIHLKKPADLEGVTFATYDGSRILSSNARKVMSKAARRIADEIKKTTLEHIAGEWRSKYRLTADANHRLAEEDVRITSNKAGVCITNKNNSQNDYYEARATQTEQGLLLGKWKTVASRGSVNGIFLLMVDPLGTVMYGYATGLDERSGTIYGTWVLAKKENASKRQIAARLKRGEELLRKTLLTWQRPGNDD